MALIQSIKIITTTKIEYILRKMEDMHKLRLLMTKIKKCIKKNFGFDQLQKLSNILNG